MTEAAMRRFCGAFRDALSDCNPDEIAPVLDENVEWTVFGPVDLFPFFGHRQGKDAVLDLCGRIASRLQVEKCETETTLVEGEHAAALMRLTALDMKSGRTLSLRLAQFSSFRDGKLTTLKAVFDTFDAAQQALGRHIDLSKVA